jgi:hypothetical protein
MYRLPKGKTKLEDDLAFQVNRRKWGRLPKVDGLELQIFPAGWTHTAYSLDPKRIIHQYRGPEHALFIRYLGNSLSESLSTRFNQHLKYLPDAWHTELAGYEWVVPAEPYFPVSATINAVDLRVEQAAVRKMILQGVMQFASEQRAPAGDMHNLPVTGIIVWFDVGNGYASVHFDVRAPFENDGAYSHQEFAALPRENWRQLTDRLCDGHEVTLTQLNGAEIKIEPGRDFDIDEAFGLMVLDLLNAMRTEKAFTPLLLEPGAELLIEADDAAFSWPFQSEDRGKVNRV